MEIEYDKEADALYITLRDGEFDHNQKVDDNTILDFDKSGNLLGIEVLWVSERMPPQTLSELHIRNILAV